MWATQLAGRQWEITHTDTHTLPKSFHWDSQTMAETHPFADTKLFDVGAAIVCLPIRFGRDA